MGIADGKMDVLTRFESGQQISYSGILEKGKCTSKLPFVVLSGIFRGIF